MPKWCLQEIMAIMSWDVMMMSFIWTKKQRKMILAVIVNKKMEKSNEFK